MLCGPAQRISPACSRETPPNLTDIYMGAAYTDSGPCACTVSPFSSELVSPGPYPALFSGPVTFAYLLPNT